MTILNVRNILLEVISEITTNIFPGRFYKLDNHKCNRPDDSKILIGGLIRILFRLSEDIGHVFFILRIHQKI